MGDVVASKLLTVFYGSDFIDASTANSGLRSCASAIIEMWLSFDAAKLS